MVELLLDTTESIFVGADIAENLGGDVVLGVKALELLLEVDALEVQGANGVNDAWVLFARDPGEVAGGVDAMEDLCRFGVVIGRVGVEDGGERLGDGGAALIGDIARDCIDGVDRDSHGELVQVAVIEDAATGSDLKGALLLQGCARYPLTMPNHLKPDEAAADEHDPE
jgi:hypothetical protein